MTHSQDIGDQTGTPSQLWFYSWLLESNIEDELSPGQFWDARTTVAEEAHRKKISIIFFLSYFVGEKNYYYYFFFGVVNVEFRAVTVNF